MRRISLINTKIVKGFLYRRKNYPARLQKKCVIVHLEYRNSKTNMIGNNIVILDSLTK